MPTEWALTLGTLTTQRFATTFVTKLSHAVGFGSVLLVASCGALTCWYMSTYRVRLRKSTQNSLHTFGQHLLGGEGTGEIGKFQPTTNNYPRNYQSCGGFCVLWQSRSQLAAHPNKSRSSRGYSGSLPTRRRHQARKRESPRQPKPTEGARGRSL